MNRIVIAGTNLAALTLALGLLRQGVAVTVLDSADAPIEDDAVCLIYPSTLGVLHELGVAEELVGRSSRIDRLQVWSLRGPSMLAELDYAVLGDSTAFPFILSTRRSVLTALLRERVETIAPEAILAATQVVAIGHDDGGVALSCAGPAGTVDLATRYLLAASRHGVPLETVAGLGSIAEFSQHLFHATECDVDLPARFGGLGDMASFLGERSHISTIRLAPGRYSVCQLIADIEQMPDDAAAQSALRAFLGEEAAASISRSAVQPFIAAGYMSGRVIVMGPAARCLDAPVSELGLNLDLQDAADLVRHLVTDLHGDGMGLNRHMVQCRDRDLRTLSALLNSYYDLAANSAYSLKFNKVQRRFSAVAADSGAARALLRRQTLGHAPEAAYSHIPQDA